MKFLLVAVVILLLVWRWRTARSATLNQRAPPKPPTPTALSMVVCQHCGIHIPAPDAIQGAQGVYCSDAHRQLAEA